jgi:hypothetical protein
MKSQGDSNSRDQKYFIYREEKKKAAWGHSAGLRNQWSHGQVGNWVYSFIYIHLFICAYIVWAISPPCPLPPSSSPFPPRFQEEPVLPSSPNLLKRRHKQ